jgi:molecular chaperone GrpE
MSEPPPSGVAEGSAVAGQQALTPEAVEAVLADFRTWLVEFADAPTANHQTDAPAAEAIDLHTLLGQFIALRHEVNLQTRATRAQQEQNAETLRQLAQAQAVANQAEQKGREEYERPLLKSLVDLHDALSLAAREVQRVRDAVLPMLEQCAQEAETEGETPPAAPMPSAPIATFWSRWRGTPTVDPAAEVHARWEAWWKRMTEQRQRREEQARQGAERLRQMLTALTTGYTMSVQRVERALRQHGLDAITAVGAAFDPETMEVVEAILDSGQPSGTVIDEVRRGYLWNGRVFRCAQVRVAKS